MQSGPDGRDPNLNPAAYDTYEDPDERELIQRQITEELRKIPVILNGRIVYNIVINLMAGAKPIDVRKILQEYVIFSLNRGKKPEIQQANLYTNKGFLFLEYNNEDPRLDDRLSLSSWPLVQVMSLAVKKAGATPQRVAEFQARQRPQVPLYQPTPASDEMLTSHDVEDMMPADYENLKKKMMP